MESHKSLFSLPFLSPFQGPLICIIAIATLAYLVPYLIASVYQLKLVVKGESYHHAKSRIIDGVIAFAATIYSVWVIISGTSDLKTFILGIVLLLSGIFFYRPLMKNVQKIRQKKNYYLPNH